VKGYRQGYRREVLTNIYAFACLPPEVERDICITAQRWCFPRRGSNFGVLSLGLGQSCFEGAMYAFVFIWTPALQVGGLRCQSMGES
jgi:hypothetical protein